MHCAAASGYNAVIRCLLKGELPRTNKIKDDQTPRDVAAKGQETVIIFL